MESDTNNSFIMQLCFFLLVSVILKSVNADYNVDIGCKIQKADKEPEAICGSDFRVYRSRLDFKLAKCLDKIGLFEIPIYMCASWKNLVEEENQQEDIGMRFLDLPSVKQQNKWSPNSNQRIINNPDFHEHKRLENYIRRPDMYHERKPNANRYYGRNLRGNTFPIRHTVNRSYRHPLFLHQNAERPKHYSKSRPFLRNVNNQISYATQQLPFGSAQYSNLPSFNPFDGSNEFITQTIFNPPIFHRNIVPRRVDDDIRNVYSNETNNSTCNEDIASKIELENENKAKNRDEIPKKTSKSKAVKPKQKNKPQKAANSSSNSNETAIEDVGELRSFNLDIQNQKKIDNVENSQQKIVTESSHSKVPQSTTVSDKNKTKIILQKTDISKTDEIRSNEIKETVVSDNKLSSNNYDIGKVQELENNEATEVKPEIPDKVTKEISDKGNSTTIKSS